MSWFQELAGKAENILNKIDQNAATVLQPSSSGKPDDVPVVLEVADIAAAAVAAGFKRSASALSLSSLRTEASPKPKALSLRASPSLSDVRKSTSTTTTTTVIPAVDGGGPSVSIDLMNDIDDAEASAALVASTTASTSRRSSVSSSVRTDRVEQPVFTAVAPTAGPNGDGSVNSEVLALKIVLNEIKAERDDARNEVRSLQNDLYTLQTSSNVADLEASCSILQDSNAELREL